MSIGYDETLEALRSGEEVTLQRWRTQGSDQNGRLVERLETFALFQARLLVEGEKPPRASRVVSETEADELSQLPGVVDERDSCGVPPPASA